MDSTNNEFAVTVVRKKHSLGRLDTLPFIVLYTMLYLLFSYAVASPGNKSLMYVTQGLYVLVIVSHFFVLLACQWSVRFKTLVGYKKVFMPVRDSSGLYAHVVPSNSSSGMEAIVEVEMNFLPQDLIRNAPKPRRNLRFEYNKIRFHFSPEHGSFQRTQSLSSHASTLNNISKGLESKRILDIKKFVFGDNHKSVPLPALRSLLFSQFLAPFFVFQVFCVCLWCLDEYWMYALFTLVMLVFLEFVLATTRLKTMERLKGNMAPPRLMYVYRERQWVQIMSDCLVVGDLVSLTDGSGTNTTAASRNYSRALEKQEKPSSVQVPCDLLLLSGSAILNEAMLTGESVPQVKEGLSSKYVGDTADSPLDLDLDDGNSKKHVVFGGTVLVDFKVKQGDDNNLVAAPDQGCLCSVARTGFETQQGQLLRTMAYASKETSAFSKDTFIFILMLIFFAFGSAVLVLKDGLKDDSRNRFKLLLHTVMIVTSVVPPELPMELNLAVTNSIKSLQEKKIFCTEPFRIPLGGKIDTCCFDKTGTLTSDEMVLLGVVCGDDTTKLKDLTGGDEINQKTTRVLAGCHSLTLRSNSKEVIGNPLEKAVLLASNFVLEKDHLISSSDNSMGKLHIHHRFGFESKLKRMSVVASVSNKEELMLLSKGAPEVMKGLLEVGSVPADFDRVSQYHMMKGRRVLCLAYKDMLDFTELNVNACVELGREKLEINLQFAGFIVLDCPIKKDTKSTIKELKNSSHSCVMITGDAILTAAEVARKVGMLTSDASKTWQLVENSSSTLEWQTMDGKRENRLSFEGTSKKELSRMREEGASFCITGDGLVGVALLAAKKCTKNVDLGSKNLLLFPEILAEMKLLVPLITVFARHAPRQKEAVIAALNSAGKFTMMCGDGTNDVGALKQAHVGISLISIPEIEKKRRNAEDDIKKIQKAEKKAKKGKEKKTDRGERDSKSSTLKGLLREISEADNAIDFVELGDASTASPFTSRGTSIVCCKYVILQGRCTLVTMNQIYRILGVNCLMTALTLSKLQILGVKQGDFQITAIGMTVAFLFFLLSLAKPLETLAPKRPPSTILTMHVLLSVALQFAVHAAATMAATELSLPLVKDDDPSVIPDGQFNPNPLNTSTMLIYMTATLATFMVNYQGEPFMFGLKKHKLLRNAFFFISVVLLICATEVGKKVGQLATPKCDN